MAHPEYPARSVPRSSSLTVEIEDEDYGFFWFVEPISSVAKKRLETPLFVLVVHHHHRNNAQCAFAAAALQALCGAASSGANGRYKAASIGGCSIRDSFLNCCLVAANKPVRAGRLARRW